MIKSTDIEIEHVTKDNGDIDVMAGVKIGAVVTVSKHTFRHTDNNMTDDQLLKGAERVAKAQLMHRIYGEYTKGNRRAMFIIAGRIRDDKTLNELAQLLKYD